MRPDRQDFPEPGDLISVQQMISPIYVLNIHPDRWSWNRHAESDVNEYAGNLGIVVAMASPVLAGHDEDDDSLETGPARYILFLTQAGWMLHDEIVTEMKHEI